MREETQIPVCHEKHSLLSENLAVAVAKGRETPRLLFLSKTVMAGGRVGHKPCSQIQVSH